jgi:type IV secretion system protein VirB1
MSGSSSERRSAMLRAVAMPVDAVLSDSIADLLIPRVVVELDAVAAEALGAFEETALSETDAWDANAGLDIDEVRNGY